MDIKNLNFQSYEYYNHLITVGGKLIEVPLRKGNKDGAFIDALTFTINKKTIDMVKGLCVGDAEYIANMSEILIDIFGFGITEKLGKGRYFYQAFYRLGTEKANYGTVHIGGQRDTILVELTGTACQAAKAGWEHRLYEFLKQAYRPQISRCDVAKDLFNSEYTPEMAMLDHDKGLFTVNNRKPKSECIGTSWRHEDGTGKTFAVGKRGNAKYFRCYEKGRQLGDAESQWVRPEVEFRRQKNFVVPLEILIYPGEYFSGAYEALEKIVPSSANRIETATKKAEITFDTRLSHGKNQVGRLVRLLNDMGWSAEKIVEALIAEEGKYPKGLTPEEYDCNVINQETYITSEDAQVNMNDYSPDQLDEIVKLDNKIRAFDEDILNKTEEQIQLLKEFNPDLTRWIEKWKEYKLKEYDRMQEAELNRELDFMYMKYGSLFNPKLKQRNLTWQH